MLLAFWSNPLKAVAVKLLKWIGIAVAALTLALVLLAIFIDWNWVKPYVERAISEQTGREFAIDGDLDVDLWSLKPSLRAARIRFENAHWGKHPQMIKVGAFQTSIGLVQLIQGRFIIPELIVERPVLHLAKSRRGTPNWELDPRAKSRTPAEQPQESPAPAQSSELPVIRRLVITDGLLTYRDHVNMADARLTLVEVSGSSDSADGSVVLDGQGRLDEQPWQVTMRVGASDKLQPAQAPDPVNFALNVGDTRAKVQGSMAKPMAFRGMDLSVSLRGPGLGILAPFLGNATPELPAYDVQGRVVSAPGTWRLRDFEATVGQSDLQGEAQFHTGDERPLVTADLRTRHFNYADFAGLAPPKKKQKPAPLDVNALRALDVIVSLQGDEIVTPAAALEDVSADLRLQDGRLRVKPLAIGVGGGRVRALATLDARMQPFKADVRTEVQQVNLDKLREIANANEALGGIVDGHVEISVTGASKSQMKQNAKAGALAAIDSLMVADSQLSYAASNEDTQLRVTVDTITHNGRRQIQIQGKGRYRNEPFKLDFQADPLLALANTQTDKPYAIDLKASGANTKVAAAGTLRQPLALEAVDIKLSAHGSGTDRLAAVLGKPLPDLSRYRVSARVSRKGAHWIIDNFNSRVGSSDLQGDIALATGGERPFIKADLGSRRLDYANFTTELGAESDEKATAPKIRELKPAADKPDEPPFNLAPLRQFNADISFKGKEIIAPNLALDDIAIDLAVQDGRLRVKPLAIGIGGGTINGALSVDSATPVRGNLTTTINGVDVQQIVKPLDLKSTFGILDGHTEIAIVGNTQAQIAAAPEQAALTFIHSLIIENTRLIYVDSASDTDIQITIATTETANGAEPITIEGSGRYQGEAFSLDVGVGSPLRLLEKGRPYPIEARAEVAKTTARIKGEVTQLLDTKGLNLSAAIKGPNPSKLEKLVGRPLPDLPPYEMKGDISREGAIWRLNNFAVEVGDSNLTGDVSVRTSRDPRPLVVADLKSRQLNLDDFSGRSSVARGARKGETKPAGHQQIAKTDGKAKTVLPRDEIDLSTLRVVDAKVSFNGKQIEIGLPINDLRVKGNLHDGRLALKPLDFGVLGGLIKSRLRLDGSVRPIEAQMTTDVSRVDLKKILRSSGFADESVGNIGGRANLKATGDSVADLMATLDGPLSLIMTGGMLDSLLIELAGLDVAQTLGDFLGNDEAVPIHCALIDLQARQGQVDVKTFVIDTTDTRFSGDGNIDLDHERIKFVIAPHPKDFSVLSFPTPLHVVGDFSNLSFYLGDSERGEQTALDVVQELVEGPFAGLIQLADTGAGESAACQSLLSETENEAHTVKNDAGTVKLDSDRKRGEKKAPASPETFIKSDPLQ